MTRTSASFFGGLYSIWLPLPLQSSKVYTNFFSGSLPKGY